jgi:hypothetical protein
LTVSKVLNQRLSCVVAQAAEASWGDMGVQNLWQLLQPVGRRISVETLERKVYAQLAFRHAPLIRACV